MSLRTAAPAVPVAAACDCRVVPRSGASRARLQWLVVFGLCNLIKEPVMKISKSALAQLKVEQGSDDAEIQAILMK